MVLETAPASNPKCRRFEGKVAVVTASTAGIGLATVRRLAQEGAKVVISSRKQKAVDEQVAILRSEGLEVSGIACHVGDLKAVKALLDFTKKTYGGIDVLVSNAAVNPTSGPLEECSDEAAAKILDINVRSSFSLVREAIPYLNEFAAITIISSFAGYYPTFPIAFYGVSKTALLGLVKAFNTELGPRGFRVNGICPGVVPTKFAAALVSSDAATNAALANTSLNRLGRPEEIAAGVAFLSSSDASYIAGENLVIAGGGASKL